MKTQRTFTLQGVAVFSAILALGALLPNRAEAGRWNFSVHIPFNDYYVEPPCYHGPVGWDYYPVYNPVVDRDVHENGYIDYRGRSHGQTTVEDRHASYYSPGRNEAITPPTTTVDRRFGPGYNQEIERTSWIGADGQPHSTTINRTTSRDRWGNTHTDTGVTLKSKGGSSNNPVQQTAPNPGQVNNTPPPIVKPQRVPGKKN